MSIMRPVISKIYCSSSPTVLVVRRRPPVINGGGFVVTDCSSQNVVFKVDGCGVLGRKEEVIVRNGHGESVLLIRRKGGIVQALSLHRKWEGYAFDFEGSQKQVFTLEEPTALSSGLVRNNSIAIRITSSPSSTTTETTASRISWNNFRIIGNFREKDCSIIDSIGNNIVAQIGVKKEVEELMMMTAPPPAEPSKDLYHVVVKPGMDQAFVIGVIATLDYIHGESTRC